MSEATNGDRVKVNYTGKLQDGKVIGSTENNQPVEFTIGSGQIMPGIEKGIMGMEVGERKTITIPPQDGFGPRREELVVDVNRSELPENMEPAIGQRVRMRQGDGRNIDLVITEVAEDSITLDANHPLAGQMLLFDLELVAIA